MLAQVSSPQLQLLHRGKVRDSFAIDSQRRLIVVTDRISAFDLKISTPIPRKGEILNRLAEFWFNQSRAIIDNHLLEVVDPQAMVVRECEPIRVEVVVRGAISGSMWRAWKSGRRDYCGHALPEGLTENQLLAQPLVTPTTKEESDREISAAEAVTMGLCSAETWVRMHDAALVLFAQGQQVAASKGLILADTKYEFGLCDGKLMLIDEIHTPDSSRFWDRQAWEADAPGVPSFDKEFVRRWMRANIVGGTLPQTLPPDVVQETARRYAVLYERLTGQQLPPDHLDSRERLGRNLAAAGLIRPGFVAVIMGSKGDLVWCERIAAAVRTLGVAAELRVVSAHKNGEQIAVLAAEYNVSLEPGAVIAVAGQSNGLGGALGASLNLPVFNCPPFASDADYAVNIHSSLRMPSRVPTATVLNPEDAAEAAVRALGVQSLRDAVSRRLQATRERLAQDDAVVRAASRLAGRGGAA